MTPNELIFSQYAIESRLIHGMYLLLKKLQLQDLSPVYSSCWSCKKKKTRHGRRVGSSQPSQPPSVSGGGGVALPEYGDQGSLFVISL